MSELEHGQVLQCVPIFPLPSVVLFPHTLLPLHVFEPRYLAMIDHVLNTEHQHLGVAQLTGEWQADYAGRPPVCPVFGLGQVVQHERDEQGRRNILVRGLARATLLTELPPDDPWRAVSCRVSDSGPVPQDPDARMATLRSLLATWLAGVPGLDMSRAESLFDPATAVVHVLDSAASALPFDPAVKQALLAECDVDARLDRLILALVELPPAS